MAVAPGDKITQEDLDALATLANAKLAPETSYEFGSTANWLEELNRIRGDLMPALLDGGKWSAGLVANSGPWALSRAPSLTGPFTDVEYSYPEPDSGSPSLSCFAITRGGHIRDDNGGPYPYNDSSTPSATHHTLWIGGDKDVRLRMKGYWYFGYRDEENVTVATATYSSTVPNVTWRTDLMNQAPGNSSLFFEIDTTVSPGEYTFECECDPEHAIGYGYLTLYQITPSTDISIRLDVTETASVAAPGIHGSRAVKKLSSPLREVDYPFGVFYYSFYFGEARLVNPEFGWDVTPTNLGGVFTGRGLPIMKAWDLTPVAAYGESWTAADPQDHLADFLPPNDPLDANAAKLIQGSPVGAEGISTVTPAVEYRPVMYPVHRDTDTVPNYGDFAIWGVTINRVTVRRGAVDNGSGIAMPPASKPELEFSLGCMRNGSFAAFVTESIPEGADEVTLFPVWPVFTENALAYQCTTRLQVYATPFRTTPQFENGQGFDPSQHTLPVAYPLLASHYNDTMALLGLL